MTVPAGLRALAPVGACVLLLAACGSDRVEEQWSARERLTSCGEVQLEQGERLEVVGKGEVACLEQALESGSGAELVVRYPTTEGDTVVDYYRVLADGTTEVYSDASEDSYSDQTWSFSTCAEPSSALEASC
jgi:hypothetical protein